MEYSVSARDFCGKCKTGESNDWVVPVIALYARTANSSPKVRFPACFFPGNLAENSEIMKKLIIPAMLSIVLLTSCSQALYKSKYDWVKVDPASSCTLRDSLHKKIKSLPLDPATLIAGTVTDVIVAVRDTTTAAPAIISPPLETVVPLTSGADDGPAKHTSIADGPSVHPVPGEIQHREEDYRTRTGIRKNRRYGDVDWGTLAWSAGGLAILGLLLYFSSNPFVQALLIIAEIIMCILSIAAIGLMIYGICWFLGQFIFMMDN